MASGFASTCPIPAFSDVVVFVVIRLWVLSKGVGGRAEEDVSGSERQPDTVESLSGSFLSKVSISRR
jgi:hypothetical protein